MFLNNVGSIKTTVLSLAIDTAQQLASADVIAHKRTGRHTIEIVNNSAAIVYIGDAAVTTATGLPIAAGASKIIPVSYSSTDNNLYIVCGAAVSVVLAEYFS